MLLQYLLPHLIIINGLFAMEDPYESALDQAESAKWLKAS